MVRSAERQLRKAFVDAPLHSGRSVCFATAEHGLRKNSDHALPPLASDPVPRIADASPMPSRTAVRTSLDPYFVPYATIDSTLNAGLGHWATNSECNVSRSRSRDFVRDCNRPRLRTFLTKMRSASCYTLSYRHPASYANGPSGLRGGHFHEVQHESTTRTWRYADAPFARSLCLGRVARLINAIASLIHGCGILPCLRVATALRVRRCARIAVNRPRTNGTARHAIRPTLVRPCRFTSTASLRPRASWGGVHAAAGVHARR